MVPTAITVTRQATEATHSYLGATQRYWDFSPAPGAPANVPTLFMVHGFRGDHHGLLRIVEALPSHRIVVPDLPGFGQSEALDGVHDVDAYADFVGFSFTALALGPATVLLGHSFGSIVAARWAAAHPSAIAALVLINPICEPALEGANRLASKLAAVYYRVGAALPEKLGLAVLGNPGIVLGMSSMMAKTKDRALRRYIHGQHLSYFSTYASRRVLLEAFQASITGTVRDVATRLAMPVLLIAAEKDDLGSVAGQRDLAGLIADARLEIIPEVGHLVHYETPDEAARLIENFLAGRPE
ncbi:alpha/beta fold hydrolase [Arthrobacter sp. TB 23]|uniref:alpha/beta fold hydrolase n=1 Tax=Arthrobacter sp. TB 23 TaxID=494419 RepID=UPI000316451C|nr:alpha/beta hydrolase [Arthrobacter sp. TB 23]